jgi:hypothetical protein
MSKGHIASDQLDPAYEGQPFSGRFPVRLPRCAQRVGSRPRTDDGLSRKGGETTVDPLRRTAAPDLEARVAADRLGSRYEYLEPNAGSKKSAVEAPQAPDVRGHGTAVRVTPLGERTVIPDASDLGPSATRCTYRQSPHSDA